MIARSARAVKLAVGPFAALLALMPVPPVAAVTTDAACAPPIGSSNENKTTVSAHASRVGRIKPLIIPLSPFGTFVLAHDCYGMRVDASAWVTVAVSKQPSVLVLLSSFATRRIL